VQQQHCINEENIIFWIIKGVQTIKVKSSGLLPFADWQLLTDISNSDRAFNFRVRQLKLFS
jgi:hypothetical protein